MTLATVHFSFGVGLIVCASLFTGCGKRCDIHTFRSRCEGNVAPQCLGSKLEPYTVQRIDCTARGEVCADADQGVAYCFAAGAPCEATTFVGACDPATKMVTRCVQGRTIASDQPCWPTPLLAPN